MSGWNDKSIKVIIFPQWINPADLLITRCSVKTVLTENNGIKEHLTLIKQLSWNVFFKPVIFPSDVFNHVIYVNHRDTLLLLFFINIFIFVVYFFLTEARNIELNQLWTSVFLCNRSFPAQVSAKRHFLLSVTTDSSPRNHQITFTHVQAVVLGNII